MRFSRALSALALGAAVLFPILGSAQGLAPIPELKTRVTDDAGMLRDDERAALENVLAEYEQTKGTQIAVLTVSSTAPEVIEQYGIRVAEAWKIGRKGTADGVILIVAKDNPKDLRRLRIEVGKGLEGAIPDAIAKRILDEDIAPHFRQNDYYGGLVAGINRIKGVLEGEALPAPRRNESAQGASGGFPIILIVLFIGVMLLSRLGRRRQVTYLSGNRGFGGVGPAIIGSLLGSALGRRGGGGGGFGGGGGGGFSGGGGDFGGGGASGNW